MDLNFIEYESIISSLLQEKGYTPQIGMSWSPKSSSPSGAFALITPVALSEKVGSSRGYITSDIVVTLMRNTVLTTIDREMELWSQLRDDAMDIVVEVEQTDSVIGVREIGIEASVTPLMNCCEIAVKISFEAISNYSV